MSEQLQIDALFQKFLAGNCNRQELEALLLHFEQQGTDSLLMDQIRAELEKEDEQAAHNEKVQRIVKATDKFIYKNILRKADGGKQRLNLISYSIAASILLVISVGSYLWYTKSNEENAVTLISKYGGDVAPGTNKATLTLSDGSSYQLVDDSTAIKTSATGIYYKDGKAIVENLSTPVTATITTPNGGQYKLILLDGTEVMLNAASTLSYPTRFTGATRAVTLSGEAYFEVAKNAQQPFVVNSKEQSLKVLGTRFNQYAYANEPFTTTLLEGEVQLAHTTSGKEITLQPGQQAIATNAAFKVEQVDAEEATAWVHNSFVFNNATLAQIILQLERWYDVEVAYPPGLGDKRIYAEFTRDKKLSQVLTVLEHSAGLSFKIEGRKVTISP